MAFDRLIYEKAENELQHRRFSAENLVRLRLTEIEQKIPEIIEINRRLSQTSVELSKLIITKKDNFHDNFEKIKSQNLQGQDMIKKILQKNGYTSDYLEPAYTCTICRDKGFVNGERCSCFNKLLTHFAVEKLNSEANMPECDFNHFSLSYYEGKTDSNGVDCYKKMLENYEYCLNYANNFSLNSSSLFLFGKTGTGKTHISLSIAKEISGKGFTVAYGSLLNYLRKIEKEHFGRAENNETDTLQVLLNTDLLILDDLGSEFQTNFYESTLYNILNSRINLGLPTIISSNLSSDELQKNYNDRIISRLFSMFEILMFVGEDVRQIKRLRGEL